MIPGLELRNLMYGTVISALSAISLILFDFLQFKRKKKIMSSLSVFIQNKIGETAKERKALRVFANANLWVFVEIFIILIFHYVPILFTNNAFGKMVGTGANYFGFIYFLPISFALMSLVLWIDPLKQVDLITLPYPLALGISKIGCFCAGCCNGVWWHGGMYNYKTEREEIPVQIMESACAFIIFIILMKIRDKAPKGTMFPIFVILYSSMRFVTEFWRGQLLVVGNLRLYHILCLIAIAISIVQLVIVKKFGDKISLYFENTFYFSSKLKKKYF